MRLIDAVLTSDTTALWASIALTIGSPFVRAGRVRAVIGLEYLAQASAAFFTLRAMHDGTGEVRQGMLIACPRLSTTVAHFHAGSTLLLHVMAVSRMPVVDQRGSLVRFSGRIHIATGDPDPLLLPADAPGVLQAEFSVYV